MALADNDISYIRAALDDLQGDLFSDDELDDLYTRAGNVIPQTIALAIKRLMMTAVKLETYQRKYETLNAQEVFNRLQALHDMYREEADRTETQVSIGGLQSTPRRNRDYPYTDRRGFGLLRNRRR